ncbi:MAG: imidazolonepropionase [Gammaproteobacteria bacterium HGW-Gammaproteobacteria-15]|nr:MAG: imidazolonepropionase [Gammaproteobacteria bacterium HGW-Gammaproteobacteria-15]
MNNLNAFLISIAILTSCQLTAQTIALQNVKVHTAASAGTLENITVLIKDGKINAIGTNLTLPANAVLQDLSGKVVTPGLVATDTLLGMVEISGGANAAETGSRAAAVSAGYDVKYAINPHSTAIAVARQGGVSSAIVIPNAGAGNANFAGQAAILHLGAKPEISAQTAVVWEMRTQAAGRGALFVQLQAELADVKRYARNKSAFAKGELTAKEWSVVDLDALLPIIQGKKPLIAKVDRASDILALLQLSQQEKLQLVLLGAAEGWQVANDIAASGVTVIIDPTNNLPSSFDEIAASAENTAKLHQAGVNIILKGGSSAHDASKIRFFAGMAVARGLPFDIALQAVTVRPARVFGATDFGTVAVGQKANLAIWSGDPFEPLTELTSLYINGIKQPLTSRQNQLETKYIKTLQPAAALTDNRQGQ